MEYTGWRLEIGEAIYNKAVWVDILEEGSPNYTQIRESLSATEDGSKRNEVYEISAVHSKLWVRI
jgi:hypothetical protein